ncbi:MAG: MotA/TolQ/ExbB proton channel family protein [Fibrobacteraceae bacterium]|nr:MotA/TolQ/ExbB proton channel family protein [Fibrobacteraceae bacterium]
MTELSVLEEVRALVIQGGWVMIPIFLIGLFAWVLLFERYFFYLRAKGNSVGRFWEIFKSNGETKAVSFVRRKPDGIFGSFLDAVLKYRSMGRIAVDRGLEMAKHSAETDLSRSFSTISVCAALAPMLGLLGTVSGMVHVFKTIQLFGFGNPVLLADGISEALLTTQAGLLVAFPLVLAHNYLLSKIDVLESSSWNAALKLESAVFAKEDK